MNISLYFKDKFLRTKCLHALKVYITDVNFSQLFITTLNIFYVLGRTHHLKLEKIHTTIQ